MTLLNLTTILGNTIMCLEILEIESEISSGHSRLCHGTQRETVLVLIAEFNLEVEIEAK